MPGETQAQSHFTSNLSIGPDGKLWAHNGDGFFSATALNLDSFRGKILRMNLNGTAAADNPFHDAANGITARDYVYAYGMRNPFGGAWRESDGSHYSIENGPSSNDRLTKIVAGGNYGWDGTASSMLTNAIYTWSQTTAPVNGAFIQPGTFGGSGFPTGKWDHLFVTESGATYASGPQSRGKAIVEFTLDASGNVLSDPTTLARYSGNGKGTAVGLAAGPDGLYFTDLYEDDPINGSFIPTAAGANILRIRYVGV
jgi:glucose/arabinose dehydrogenase